MKKWREISKGEKWMFVVIAMLLIGIILRWDFVKEHVGKSFNWFERKEKKESPVEPAPETMPVPSADAEEMPDSIRFE